MSAVVHRCPNCQHSHECHDRENRAEPQGCSEGCGCTLKLEDLARTVPAETIPTFDARTGAEL